jgi:DNA-binding transcriptional LysR family regulator
MKITLKQLEVFCLVAQTGSISAAAKKVYLTQPATSMTLKQLEGALGHPLFDRHAKKLILNAFGKKQLEKAKQIIDRSKDFSVTQTHQDNLEGDLYIGASLTIGNYILPMILAKFKKQHPNINIHLTIANTKRLENDLLKFHFDLIFLEGAICKQTLITSKQWKKDSLVIIANNKHPLLKKARITKKDLEGYPWVSREEGSGTLALLKDTLLKSIQPQIDISINSFEGIKHYVAASMCLSCLPESSLDLNNQKKLKIIPVAGLRLERDLIIAWHKNKFQSKCLLSLMETLNEHT